MEYVVICVAAGFTSALTLFSGFGLGTLLMPVFAIFFPVDAAIALTAVVHLFNNLFKLALLGRYAEKAIALKFGLPAIFAAMLGAKVLFRLSGLMPLFHYEWFGRQLEISPLKLVVALLIAGFAVIEFLSTFRGMRFQKEYLPLGGILSGFFGGLSGHQGALRSAFLIQCGLSKEAFIGTGVVIACMVDVGRMVVYSSRFTSMITGENTGLLVAAICSACMGAWVANRLIKKITMRFIQGLVAILLFGISVGLATGVI